MKHQGQECQGSKGGKGSKGWRQTSRETRQTSSLQAHRAGTESWVDDDDCVMGDGWLTWVVGGR